MIYFVDEDVIELKPYVLELQLRGYQVKHLKNADSAFSALVSADDIELIVLDIMLSTEEGTLSRYTRSATNNFLETGLVFLKDILNATSIDPLKFVIFSNASAEDILSKIRMVSQSYKIQYFKKKEHRVPHEFADILERRINTLS